MKTYLVTGGAGFIGSNYIRYMLDRYGDSIRIINVDALTYAGNLENLRDVEKRDNYTFVKAARLQVYTGKYYGPGCDHSDFCGA